MKKRTLEYDLALALEVASIRNLGYGPSGINVGDCLAWGNPSDFQTIINALLVRAGRKPVPPKDDIRHIAEPHKTV